jgi:hypothetical protein
MPLVSKQIDDPRDNLSRATRHEIIQFAKKRGVTEIDPEMPAILMRDILRQKNITDIQVGHRPLGSPGGTRPVATQAQEQNIRTVDATSELARQWKAQQKPVKKYNEFIELKMKAKKLGIKLSRTDRLPDLKEKLEKHGKNAA